MAEKIYLRSPTEIEKMRTAGKLMQKLWGEVEKILKSGMTTAEIDAFIHTFICDHGMTPSFLGYLGFPSASCVSVNQEILHGIPGRKVIHRGDLVKVDVGICYQGYHVDSARSFAVEVASPRVRRLIEAAENGFLEAVKGIKPGYTTQEVGRVIKKTVTRYNFFITPEYTGHGIGRNVHEAPAIYNYAHPDSVIIQERMGLAVEVLVVERTQRTVVDRKDNWTVSSADGSWCAHYEDTIIVTPTGSENLTRRVKEENGETGCI